jgi:mono/diheme cytochrome c family protein
MQVSKTSALAGAALALAATIAFASRPAEGAAQKTSNDGVYTKAQADRARAQFTKMCAECHAFTVATKKRPGDVLLGDAPFLKTWAGRPLDQIVTTIVMTMPNDGSGEVTEPQGVDLVAYILQQNGYPAGSTPLTKAGAAEVVLRPKK